MTNTVRLAATLRPAAALPAGDYRLRPDKCVVELAVLGPVRGRVQPVGGTFAVNFLELDLDPATLPFLRGWLVKGLDKPLALRARTVFSDEETVVLTAFGKLSRRWIRVTLAAEFTR